MKVSHYLKQGIAWFNSTWIANFIYRLSAFCCGLLIYVSVMSFMLILLLLLALYKLSFGLIMSQQQNDAFNSEPGSDNAKDHFNAHKLPALPKW